MWFFTFYRFYTALLAGFAAYWMGGHTLWSALGIAVVVRVAWFGAERFLDNLIINRNFRRRIQEFKHTYGPYGIRIANKADTDQRVKRSLAEVFVTNRSRLRKTVDQLEALDALFQAGLHPDGDEFLLHDLKLKFGRHRLGERQ